MGAAVGCTSGSIVGVDVAAGFDGLLLEEPKPAASAVIGRLLNSIVNTNAKLKNRFILVPPFYLTGICLHGTHWFLPPSYNGIPADTIRIYLRLFSTRFIKPAKSRSSLR